jgi:hypothetical protein
MSLLYIKVHLTERALKKEKDRKVVVQNLKVKIMLFCSITSYNLVDRYQQYLGLPIPVYQTKWYPK